MKFLSFSPDKFITFEEGINRIRTRVMSAFVNLFETCVDYQHWCSYQFSSEIVVQTPNHGVTRESSNAAKENWITGIDETLKFVPMNSMHQ